ncbi:MAG: glycoside hydrolase family 130 protein [Candidatus Omnitrophica bacterium]|nr:glycoside hydrolase family 130 protein [Candidatus Omnitrophota bacterium]
MNANMEVLDVVTSKYPICRRYGGNPILTGKDFPADADIKSVFNSGIVKYNDIYLMVCRVENSALLDRFWIAESTDGYHFEPRLEPVDMPHDDPEFMEYAGSMYYDPRLTKIGDTYYIVHAAHSSHTCRLSLVKTEDFKKFQWMGFISETDNRNGVLFPEKINGLYARLDRPNTGADTGDIWVSYSPDLIFWGKSECVFKNWQGIRWAWTKIGPGATPIKTPGGWLTIFHGVRSQCKAHFVYQLGVCLLDLDDPSKVKAMSESAILIPEEQYELVGQTPSVVFTCGAVAEDDGEIKIYYGGADTVQCVAITSVERLIDACYNR